MQFKKLFLFSLLAIYAFHNLAAQEQQEKNIVNPIMENLKISGYIQAEYQYGEKDAVLKVGDVNEGNSSFSRIGVRRGLIKMTYTDGIGMGVFQLNITEKGINLKDLYINIKDPWIGTNALRVGIFSRPFGYEVGYSSSQRESPERASFVPILFPDERDLGAMLVLQAKETSPWSLLKFEGGFFAGNGIKAETDSRLDFIGHLTAGKKSDVFGKWNVGISYYGGSVFEGTDYEYRMQNRSFITDSAVSHKNDYAKRRYIGFDVQYSIDFPFGLTKIRAEYIFGTQPATQSSSKSPNSSTRQYVDTYIRKFSGGYVYFIQNIGKYPVALVLKYDWYDPNTQISGNEINENNTMADVAQSTLGCGVLWDIYSKLRLQAYYEWNKNEQSHNFAPAQKDLADNVFTFRLQYKF